MLREDANRLAFRPAVLLKRIGHDALDRVAQPFELRLPFVGPGALLTVQVVQRATAYFTVDDSRSVHHRKQKHHPLCSITHEAAPRQQHRPFLIVRVTGRSLRLRQSSIFRSAVRTGSVQASRLRSKSFEYSNGLTHIVATATIERRLGTEINKFNPE